MNDQERAEQHLRTIRRLMERGTIYRAISAPTALVGGLLSLCATVAWLAWTGWGWESEKSNGFLPLWLLVLLLTAGTNTLFIVLGAKNRNEPIFSSSMKAAFTALAPPFLVAAVLTSFFAKAASAPLDNLAMSLIWATCYGLGLLATSHFAPRSLMLLGWAFLTAGLAAFLSVGFSGGLLPVVLKNPILFMALTFGLFHLIYALCAWPRKGTEPEP